MNDRSGSALVDHEPQLGGAAAVTDRYGNGPEPGRGQENERKFDSVAEQEDDPVASSHTQADETRG